MKRLLTISIILFKVDAYGQDLRPIYSAGESIKFSYNTSLPLNLLIVHSYGSILVAGEVTENQNHFTIPDVITHKKGILELKLFLKNTQVWATTIEIIPAVQGDKSIEAYCGPKHLLVNKHDYTMITTSVLDSLDNPFPRDTKVAVQHLIDKKIELDYCKMNGLIAHKKVYASDELGYGSISANYEGVGSKEFRINFYANDPDDFSLFVERQHVFADGNQLIRLSTSVIKDRNDNLLENGTLVSFGIIDSGGRRTIAFGETILGTAVLEIPAPSHPTEWLIQAWIPTYAFSNTEKISFLPALEEIPTRVNSKELIIGPFLGFMMQFMREGMIVEVTLENDARELHYKLPIEHGMAILNFEKQFIQKGEYFAHIEVAGLSKTIILKI